MVLGAAAFIFVDANIGVAVGEVHTWVYVDTYVGVDVDAGESVVVYVGALVGVDVGADSAIT